MLQIRLSLSVRSSFHFPRHCATAAIENTRIRTLMANPQPPWTLPVQQAGEPVLKLYNSLTRTKVRKRRLSRAGLDLTMRIDGICSAKWETRQMV